MVPIAFEHLRHRQLVWVGIAEVCMPRNESGELDLRGAKVACAEATADCLSSTCVEPTGAPLAAVWTLAEEVVADAEGFASRHARYSAKWCSPIWIFLPVGPNL